MKWNVIVFTFLLFSCSVTGFAQVQTIKYYDSTWIPSIRDSSFYYTKTIKINSIYQCTSYYTSTNKLFSKDNYLDTMFTQRIGISQHFYVNGQTKDSFYYENPNKLKCSYGFYENGSTQDSIFYKANGYMEAFHYFQNGNLHVHYIHTNSSENDIINAFDEAGNKITDFIYRQEATLSNGALTWNKYIQTALNPLIPTNNKAPNGTYTVVIRFVVDTLGKVSIVKPETHFGFGMEEEVIRVLKGSPQWKSAIYLGKKVKAFHRQPITFVVNEN